VAADRWVHCRFCQQTYLAGDADGCSLCGKTGGLHEVPPPARSAGEKERASWAPATGPDAATSLAAGCFLLLVGTVLGVVVALSMPTAEPEQPARTGTTPNSAHQAAGLSAVISLFYRVVVGALLGLVGGGLIAVILLALWARVAERSRPRSN
jgi:hypothetical protein